jgi:hypothetical protein
MENKNLDPGPTLERRRSLSLMERDDLDVVEKAVEMSAPQMKLAALSDNPGAGNDAVSAFRGRHHGIVTPTAEDRSRRTACQRAPYLTLVSPLLPIDRRDF